MFIILGKEVHTKIIRNGQETAYIAKNKYFKFNYEYYNFLANPVKLRKVKIF